jgi:hypothetical protein
MPLTIDQLEPGKFYTVVDAGTASNKYVGAVVMGIDYRVTLASRMGHKAILIRCDDASVRNYPGMGFGAKTEKGRPTNALYEPFESTINLFTQEAECA